MFWICRIDVWSRCVLVCLASVYPPGYFVCKVPTDKDLSTKLSLWDGKCAAALAGSFFSGAFSPYLNDSRFDIVTTHAILRLFS